MGFIRVTPTGRFQGAYYAKVDGKRKTVIGPSCDFRYQAEEWWQTHEPPKADRSEVANPQVRKTGWFEGLLTATVARPRSSADRLSVGEYAVRWLGRQTHVRPNTRTSYRAAIHNGIINDEILRGFTLTELETDDVLDWLARQDAAGVGRAAQNYRLKVLRMIMKSAVLNRQLGVTFNATEGIRRRKLTNQRQRLFLSEDQVSDLLDAAGEGQLRLILLLGVDAGLRWQEIAALNAASVITSGPSMTIRVWQSVSDDRHRTVENTTKNGEERSVPVVTDRLRKALSLAAKQARVREGQLDALLMTHADGQPMRYEFWQDRLRAAMTTAGIAVTKGTGFHDLRHTYGSTLAASGVPTKMIATLLGHSDVKVTEVYMQHSPLTDLRTAASAALAGR